MSFFKPLTEGAANKSISRLHTLIWALIYGGLLATVLGLFVQRTDDTAGWFVVVMGCVAAIVGCALIYVRSKLKTEA